MIPYQAVMLMDKDPVPPYLLHEALTSRGPVDSSIGFDEAQGPWLCL